MFIKLDDAYHLYIYTCSRPDYMRPCFIFYLYQEACSQQKLVSCASKCQINSCKGYFHCVTG